MKVSILAGFSFLCLATTIYSQIPGGSSDIPVTDKGAVAAARFAVEARGKKEKENVALVKILRAESQVVAGRNYHLLLEVGVDGGTRKAQTSVWNKLDGTQELTKWEWKSAVVSLAPDIDAKYYYRLTSGWQKENSIDVINDGDKNDKLHLVKTDEFTGQYWKVAKLGDGTFRFTNRWQDDKSLNVVNDGKNDQVYLSKTEDVSGQRWKVTKFGDGTFRLTSGWQKDKSLDVVNEGEKDQVHLAVTGDFTGQQWKLEKTEDEVE